MNQTQALAKLKQLLGPKFSYRVDSGAPDADTREDLLAESRRTRAAMKAAEAARWERKRQVLAADPEYQRLKLEHESAIREHDAVPSCHRKRITVGRLNSMFFSVVADGDNWAEVVEKVKAERAVKEEA